MNTSTMSIFTLALVITAFTGCVSNKMPNYYAIEYESQTPWIRKVAVIADTNPPEIESVNLGVTRGEGAARGAASGAVEGLGSIGNCSGDFCGPALLLVLPVVIVGGAIIGAVSGSVAGHPADILAEAEANARQALDSAYLQTQLIDHAQNYGNGNVDVHFIHIPGTNIQSADEEPDYKALTDKSIDAILEVELIRLKLSYSLEMDARARLISVRTRTVISDNEYKFNSESHKLDEWMANGAAPLTDAIHRGLRTLAEDIVDENFLLFYPSEPAMVSTEESGAQTNQPYTIHSKSVPHYALNPDYPPLNYRFFRGESPFSKRRQYSIANLEFVEVDSVQPTLRWEPFPRDYDLTAEDGRTHQIADVRYDLRVFEATGASPGQQAYEVRNLPEPYHNIQTGLKACTNYFWTVRARFKLDGRIRATEWAGAFSVDGWNEKPWNLRRELPSIYKGEPIPPGPQWFYYPFRTPCN